MSVLEVLSPKFQDHVSTLPVEVLVKVNIDAVVPLVVLTVKLATGAATTWIKSVLVSMSLPTELLAVRVTV